MVARAPAPISPLAATRRPRRSRTTRSCTSSPRLVTLRRSAPGATTGRYTVMWNSRSATPTAVEAGCAPGAAPAPDARARATAGAASTPARRRPRVRVMVLASAPDRRALNVLVRELDALELLVLDRAVVGAGRRPLDRVDRVHALGHPAEHRVLPSSHGAASVVTMKNCEPFVLGPALAIARAPRSILWSLNSSSKV